MEELRSIEEDLDDLSSLQNYHIDLRDYSFTRLLGKGTYGNVWLGMNRYTGWDVAVKELITTEIDAQQLEFFKREISIYVEAKDMFLLDCIGFSVKPPYSIVTPYMRGGTLWDQIHNSSRPLNGTQKTNIALGIAHGMRVLHAKNIIHRDLKSPNILLDNKVLPRISDFGLGKFVTDSEKSMTKCVGTPLWMAPEQITSDEYGPAVDVYAFAIILYELLTELIPFQGFTDVQIFKAIENKHRPVLPNVEGKPKSVQNICRLIQICWNEDPEKRPSFDKIFRLFATHQVEFPGCQKQGVETLLKKINAYDTLIAKSQYIEPPKISHVLSIREEYKKAPFEIADRLCHLVHDGKLVDLSYILVALPNSDINARNGEGKAPLHIACADGNIDIVRFLIGINSININIADEKGRTPAMVALKYNRDDVFSLIIHNERTNFNATDKFGQSLLHYAAILGNVAATKILVGLKGFNLHIRDKKGRSALDRAKEYDAKDIISLLPKE